LKGNPRAREGLGETIGGNGVIAKYGGERESGAILLFDSKGEKIGGRSKINKKRRQKSDRGHGLKLTKGKNCSGEPADT